MPINEMLSRRFLGIRANPCESVSHSHSASGLAHSMTLARITRCHLLHDPLGPGSKGLFPVLVTQFTECRHIF